MSKVTQITPSQTMVILEGRNEGRFLLFNTELHDKRGQRLYALSTPNDVISTNTQRWQLADLLNANELARLLGIDPKSEFANQCLPVGVRESSPQFEEYRMMKSPSNGHSSG